jgi:hypothetical protein
MPSAAIDQSIQVELKILVVLLVDNSVHDNNVYNFDKIGFQMGIIGSMKVATGAEECAQPELVQAGNHKWITVI